VLNSKLTEMSKTLMRGMGLDPEAMIQKMRQGIEEEKRKRQTPVEILFYHCDHLGTPLALTDRQGQVAWAAKYDPWGNVEEEFNPRNLEQDIRLPGQHLDRETGLYYNYRRYYDPRIGAYINQDPIGLRGGLNLYQYANANPIRYFDSLGLDPAAAVAASPTIMDSLGTALRTIGAGISSTAAGIGGEAILVLSIPGSTPVADRLRSAHEAAVKAGGRTQTGYGGNCTPDRYDELRKEQDTACGKPESVTPEYPSA